MAMHSAVPRVITCDNAYGIKLNAQLLEHELHLEQLTELEENALAPLGRKSEPPNSHDIGTARLESLNEKPPPLRFDFRSKAGSSVRDANSRALDVGGVRADGAADTGGADALRDCSRGRRHKHCHDNWRGQLQHARNLGPRETCYKVSHDGDLTISRQ